MQDGPHNPQSMCKVLGGLTDHPGQPLMGRQLIAVQCRLQASKVGLTMENLEAEPGSNEDKVIASQLLEQITKIKRKS